MLTIAIEMRLESVANLSDGWRARKHRNDSQRQQVLINMCASHLRGTSVPSVVLLTRVGKRLLDTDNLASAFKAIRDEVAAFYEVDDGPEGPIEWRYDQRQGPYAIEIGIET